MPRENVKKRIKIHLEIMHQSNLNRVKTQVIPITNCHHYILGRSPQRSDIVLNDPGVSGVHLSITFQDNQLWIKDLSTKNGTFVNSRNITHKELNKGDMIAIGRHILTVKRIERIFDFDDPTHIFLGLNKKNLNSTLSQVISKIVA